MKNSQLFFMLCLMALPLRGFAVDLRVNGFGDFAVGMKMGDPPSAADAAAFSSDGIDGTIKNTNQGFGLAGTDFVVTTDLTDRLVYQTEINLQVERGGSSAFELDVERMYLDYLITKKFNIMAGLYFTPIGYSNRNLYARAWLMRSIQVRDHFEEELGLVPTHTIGINFHGIFDVGKETGIMYSMSIGNGRGSEADAAIYARDSFNFKELTFLLELQWRRFKNFRVGVSGWLDEINSVGTSGVGTGVGTGSRIKLVDRGFDGYIVFEVKRVSLLAEYFVSSMRDVAKNLGGGSFTTHGFTAELSYSFLRDRLHPYVRFDYTNLPSNGGPYYGVRSADMTAGTADRKYVPEFNALMFGAAYDLFDLNRIKLEYILHLDGPRKRHGIVGQTAFAF